MRRIWNFFDKLIFDILVFVLRGRYTEEKRVAFMHFAKFCIVGLSNAVIYYVVYAGTLLLFRHLGLFSVWAYQVSQVLGFFVSVYWAFCLNRAFVFNGANGSYLKALLRFYLTYAVTGLFMNSILLYIWNGVGVSVYIAPLINVCFTTPTNYILSKFWTFKKSNQ